MELKRLTEHIWYMPFETGIKREDLCRKLESTIRMIGPKICVEGHWVPVDVEDTLKDLMEFTT